MSLITPLNNLFKKKAKKDLRSGNEGEFSTQQGDHVHGGTPDAKFAEEDMKKAFDSNVHEQDGQSKLLKDELTTKDLDNVGNTGLTDENRNLFRFDPNKHKLTMDDISRTDEHGFHR